MNRVILLLVVLCIAVSGFVSDADAEVRWAIQAGLGAANVAGSPGFGGYQVVTLSADAMFFLSKWAVALVGVSYGFPHKYERVDSDGTDTIEIQSSYLDGLVGVYKSFAEGGYVHLGLGLTAAWGNFDRTPSPDDSFKLKTSAGLLFGVGMALPITDTMQGFVNARQRIVSADLEETDLTNGETRTNELSTGGTELVVGLAWAFNL